MVKLRLRTSRREEAIDVTERVRRAIAESGIREGTCTVFAPHTTCAIAVNEGHDPAVMEDFLNHMRGATVPITAGALTLGQWQSIFMCEFDGPRERSLWVSVTGEGRR
ncbi:MAG: hypothetical protein AUG49_12125 [Catenulispora sp. 13_1_20CM_3_70_7]|nr:MAG: hypothetical protein AUG49_12125 [Catenulispora sp. 13_1_20CM_3_70_7]